MSRVASKVRPSNTGEEDVPPLENGDHLTGAEFLRRYKAMPELKKAELINGQVYLADSVVYKRRDPTIPPLENGDHLTNEEFAKRYDNMIGLKKAELIEGRVFVAPPVSLSEHGRPQSHLVTLLAVYSAGTPGTDTTDNASLKSDDEAWPQPDGLLIVLPSHGGQTNIDDEDYLCGAPELVVEISASSAHFDLHEKYDLYLRGGVREYIVWRTRDHEFDYFLLRGGEYQRLVPDRDKLYHSEVFPGLWIDAAALLQGDFARALAQLQVGLASPEHQTFIAALRQKSAARKGGTNS